MIETITLLPGITLRVCRDTRFKQGCLSFQLVRQMDKAEAAMNALLPAVLLRGTEKHPDLRSITEHLDELYGASVSPLVRRVGDYQTTGLYCGFMDDRFALPGDQVLRPMMGFLEDTPFYVLAIATALASLSSAITLYGSYRKKQKEQDIPENNLD